MLGKLLKYELKATSRWFLPLYAAIVFFAIINRLLFSDPVVMDNGFSMKQIMQGISMVIYVILMIGIMAVTLVVSIQRFYKSLLGDEGYLMFTLPVQPWKHILNKLIIAMLWNFLSIFIAMGSILIMMPRDAVSEFFRAFAELRVIFGTAGYFTLPVLGLVSLAFGVLQIYASIALGHLFNKHKLLASFGMYIGINTVCQFVMMLMIPSMMNSIMKSVRSDMIMPSETNTIVLMFIIFTAVLGAGCFVLTDMLLKKKLNLE